MQGMRRWQSSNSPYMIPNLSTKDLDTGFSPTLPSAANNHFKVRTSYHRLTRMSTNDAQAVILGFRHMSGRQSFNHIGPSHEVRKQTCDDFSTTDSNRHLLHQAAAVRFWLQQVCVSRCCVGPPAGLLTACHVCVPDVLALVGAVVPMQKKILVSWERRVAICMYGVRPTGMCWVLMVVMSGSVGMKEMTLRSCRCPMLWSRGYAGLDK